MLDINQPTLLVNESICRKNIRKMVEKSKSNNLVLRPHFKTHQSHKIGEWFREEGIKNITVSSMEMAIYFNGQFDHITLAIPFNLLQLSQLHELAQNQSVAILVDQVDTIEFLANKPLPEIGIWIELDTGSHRSGVSPSEIEVIQIMVNRIRECNHLKLEGLYSHAGHTYRERSVEGVKNTFNEARNTMLEVRAMILGDRVNINLGDTPGCTLATNFEGIDSISPGNFVFYDTMQVEIQSCDYGDIGVCLACPIISKNQDRLELVIYGGGIHLSKDRMDAGDDTHYGILAGIEGNTWTMPPKEGYLRSISQEHGVLKVSKEVFNQYKVGDIVGILPVHSCMTADCMGRYLSEKGEEIDHMRRSR